MQTTIDLQKFCAKENTRWVADHPIVRTGFVYASDARILIRLPAPGEPDTPPDEKGNLPTPETIDLSIEEPATPWPQSEPIEALAECEACEGEGYTDRVQCDECEGTGQIDCPTCGNDMDCERCRGNGYTHRGKKCERCNGDGRYMQPAFQRVGDGYVAYRYDQMVRSLGDVHFVQKKGDHGGIRFNFRFDGGVGAVMSKTYHPHG